MRWRSLVRSQGGQGALEYLLVVGAVVVAMAVAFMGFDSVIGELLGHVCPSVDTAANPLATVGSCIASAGP